MIGRHAVCRQTKEERKHHHNCSYPIGIILTQPRAHHSNKNMISLRTLESELAVLRREKLVLIK